MRDLEQAIADWRRQLVAGGVKTPEVLDELESHLREEVKERMRAGADVEEAFQVATEQLGRVAALKTEFRKAQISSAQVLIRLVGLLLVGFILWMSGFTFMKLDLNAGEQIVAYAGVVLTLVAACGWRFAVPHLPVILHTRGRMAAGGACILSGFIVTNLFCNFVLPHFEQNRDGQLPAIGFWAVLPIAVFAGLGLGLMMSVPDRQHWRMETPMRE